jgi:hypothetical protein
MLAASDQVNHAPTASAQHDWQNVGRDAQAGEGHAGQRRGAESPPGLCVDRDGQRGDCGGGAHQDYADAAAVGVLLAFHWPLQHGRSARWCIRWPLDWCIDWHGG